MALTDSEQAKKYKRAKHKPLETTKNLRWSDKQKVEAAAAWLALGNLALVSRLLGIPEVTLRFWKASTWWKDLVDELKMQEKLELSSRMKRIIDASQTVVLNRLENGDPVILPKTGAIVYKPVSMKDAHQVGRDLIDRRAVIEKATMDVAITDDRADDKLERLAEKFAEMATKSIEKQINNKRTVDVEEVIPRNVMEENNALDEERQTRLQEGICSVPGETGTDCEADGTDSGTESV